MANLLEIEPREHILLERTGRTATLRLRNVRNSSVAFKVKTNKPEFYTVRPNQGIISPGKSQAISITLKILPRDVVWLDHKFSIVHCKTELKGGQESQLAEFWKQSQLQVTRQVLTTVLRSPEISPEQENVQWTFPDPPEPQKDEQDLVDKYKKLQKLAKSQAVAKEKLESRLDYLHAREEDVEREDSKQMHSKHKGDIALTHVVIALLLGMVVGLCWLGRTVPDV